MEIGIERKREASIVNLSHSNQADVRQRRWDVMVSVEEFTNRRSFFGQTHSEPHCPGFNRAKTPQAPPLRWRSTKHTSEITGSQVKNGAGRAANCDFAQA